MKKCFFVFALLLLAVSVSFAQVNVTFYLNTATVPDTVTEKSVVQVRGGTAPLTWGDDTGGVMEHVDGDLWRVTLPFNAADSVDYKYNVRTNPSDEAAGGWEAGPNLNVVVPASDTTLDVAYYRKADVPTQDPPFAQTDSIDLWFRINIQGFTNFNSLAQFVGLRGAIPGSDWATNILLSPETPHTDAGNFTYPVGNFWSGQAKIASDAFAAGDTIAYKFVTIDAMTPDAAVISWEDNLDRSAPWVDDGGNRIFRVPSGDSTIVWDFFDDAVPVLASNADTVIVTFAADMTRAIESRGFTPGDTLFTRAGFNGTANELTDISMFQIEGTSIWTGQDTLISTVGGLVEYDYRLSKRGQEIRESYFDFDFVPEDQSQQGRAERRRAMLTDVQTTITDDSADELDARRQPFFPNNEALAQDVVVTFEVDMRPAIFELLFSDPVDTLKDIQGNRDIFDPADVIASGIWINGLATGGWQTWGGTLAADTTRTMYDDGTHGDAAAGDTIYTRQYFFSPDSIAFGTQGRVGQVFKFGIRGGDNEGGFGNNHVANIDDSEPSFTFRSQFGSIDPKKYDHWDFGTRTPNPTSVDRIGEIVPGTFSLAQNYPNPFNPSTSIHYTLAKGSEIKLTVYNMLGQKVVTLVDATQVAGEYLATWNGQNDAGLLVSSGVYVYKLEVKDNFVQTRKMLFLK